MPKIDRTDITSIARLDETGRLLLSTEALASVLGVTRHLLAQWAREGCPKVGRGWYSLADVMRWRGLVGDTDRAADDTILGAKERKIKAEAQIKELQTVAQRLKLDELEGRLIRADDARAEIAKLFDCLHESFVYIGCKLTGTLAKTHPDVLSACQPVVDSEINAILDRLAKGRATIPGPKPGSTKNR